MQEQLFRKIKQLIPEHKNLMDEISGILDINYDAAYRRVNGMSKLSLNEAVILAKHYRLSLNKLFEVGEQNSILTQVSPHIATIEDLESYFKVSLSNIQELVKLKSASITYSAKDIPLFYTLKDSYITKYKCYVWLKFLNENGSMAKLTFTEFLDRCPSSLFKAAHELGSTYDYINITEFWNDNTINGSLQQILYYFETGRLDEKHALLICKDLHGIIDHVEKQCISQAIDNNDSTASYQLYTSDLLTMSNTIMVQTKNERVFFTPFTVLTYLKVEHKPTCDRLANFFEQQMKSSKLLVHSGEKDRAQFFERMRIKINRVAALITAQKEEPLF
ncbi:MULTISPECIES: hypothetical protein [Nonlabens]|uniref:hypothetical protein n=1 Tax=Nonlabens TaxID=363408 RepID=UPI000CF55689|nr:hypothetical protein [Nonlabens tegetincola]MEE2802742.1 hypothetical protein [Bacteroidota bacterium]PQJ18490.1 hypothetical protein BST93_08365 [Nonlabens tegetincola]